MFIFIRQGKPPAAQTESAAEAAGETAEAGAETGEAKAAEGVMPAIPKEDLKVGVIHIGNPGDGSGYSYAHDLGIVAMQEAVGLEDSQIIRKNNVADDDQTAIETAMRECVEEGCQDYLRHKLGLHGCMRSACRRVPGGYLLPWYRI